MEWWAEIRCRVLAEGVSRRQILRETGIHWKTLEKILRNEEPPGYRQKKPRKRPRIGPFLPRICQIIDEDKSVPKKQRHTAKRIFERIRDEGYTGGYTQVKEAVREIKQRTQEVFVPLIHRPGEAQFDFGQALVKQGGELRRIHFAVMCLPYSGAFFVQAFERAPTETMWEAHCRAFAFFGGVPRRITYDNDGVLVSTIRKGRERTLTHGFLQLQSHYLFRSHFCRVRRPNEKGVVEGLVRFARQNFLVPVPQVRDLKELNDHLSAACEDDLKRKQRDRKASKETFLAEDRASFLPLPPVPFDASRKESMTSNSLSVVRFDGNDYSVPVRYAHHDVVAKGYVDRVQIYYQGRKIATHQRLWDKGDGVFDPLHYLALLERKPGALDHARPLVDWHLPECFSVLRRRQEAELNGKGTREHIRVLRLLEEHSLASVTRAVARALEVNALTRDAIAQFLIPQEDWRLTTFELDGREHLKHVKVAQTDISAYRSLLTQGDAP